MLGVTKAVRPKTNDAKPGNFHPANVPDPQLEKDRRGPCLSAAAVRDRFREPTKPPHYAKWKITPYASVSPMVFPVTGKTLTKNVPNGPFRRKQSPWPGNS
jgi:hypothetical protein